MKEDTCNCGHCPPFLERRFRATKHELGSQPAKTVLIAAEDSVHHGWEYSMLEHSILALQKGNKEEGMHSSGRHLLRWCLFNLSFQVKGHTLPTFRLEHLDLLIPSRKSLTHTTRRMCLWIHRWFLSTWHCINLNPYLLITVYLSSTLLWKASAWEF